LPAADQRRQIGLLDSTAAPKDNRNQYRFGWRNDGEVGRWLRRRHDGTIWLYAFQRPADRRLVAEHSGGLRVRTYSRLDDRRALENAQRQLRVLLRCLIGAPYHRRNPEI